MSEAPDKTQTADEIPSCSLDKFIERKVEEVLRSRLQLYEAVAERARRLQATAEACRAYQCSDDLADAMDDTQEALANLDKGVGSGGNLDPK